ncbi:HEPN domain-containing protein [Sinomicrobium weinanense]|uniref:HEPN domain-containing protein n=1 Tax=Sinomicrobium weinanense TaxID=2842200 RepID=A0A926Q3Z2_9FLAO|nr:HEPN domain-containing protein [Sinomicrobium weinanense]MBC9798082.1 HEPN domain-containing protein [Sinomicrobium weinanense]MBU3122556.1 HEPN domain-containing protein [Sinomicrobium weinanense]
MNTSIQEAINRLTNLLEAQYIYASAMPAGKEERTLLVVLLKEGDPGLSEDVVSLTGKVFREHTGFLLRVYSLPYAERLIREGNLFFIRICQTKNLVYRHPEQHAPAPAKDMDQELALAAAKRNFDSGMARARAFREGAVFFEKKEDYSQAAFMLHQSVELGFRLAELEAMGKEKICHSITGHRKYVKVFIPELYTLFNPEKEEENNLLQLLDHAYKGVRYSRDFSITPEQLAHISVKSEKQLAILEKLFNPEGGEIYGTKSINKEKAGERSSENTLEEFQNIKQGLQKLVAGKFFKLRPGSPRTFYKSDFMFDGPADVLYNVSGLIKVCIVALGDSGDSFSELVPQPHINIRSALEFALQLLPYEEMEYLDDLIKNIDEIKIPME